MSEQAPVGMARRGNLGKFANWDTTKCTHTLQDAVEEIEREGNVRMKCYDRWVSEGKMTEVEAQTRLGSLASAWHLLMNSDEGKAMVKSNKRADLPF